MKIFNFITKQCLTLLCTAFITTQANASVCFLPDADNCGTNDIVTQCDGIRFFAPIKGQSCAERVNKYHNMKGEDGQDRLSYMSCSSAGDCDELKCAWSESTCKANADSRSSKNGHYECYLDSDNNCWYQTYTPCNEYDEPASNPSYPLDSPEDGKACKANTWSLTHHLCSDKGIASTQKGTRTTYDCVTIVPKVSGCDGYNLSSPISGYDCDPCEPDVYKNDYDGNYNYSGKGNTVYSCSKSEGCSGYSLTASEASSKEASGDYRCHDCTPKNTDSNGVTTDGTTVYKCGKITTSTNDCSDYNVSQADKASKESQGYSCGDTCTPTTTYYEDGVEYDAKSGATVYKCKAICEEHTDSKSKGCTGNTYFVGAGANFPGTSDECGDCVDCADENNLPTTSECHGMHICEGAREPKDETPCMCGPYKYYQRCLVVETCNTDSYWEAKKCEGTCDSYWDYYSSASYTRGRAPKGYYYVGEKCRKTDLTYVDWYASCTSEYYDINGGTALAKGMKTCPNNEGADGASSVECGGYTYFSECKETCNTDEEKNWYSDIREWGYCYATTNKNNTETNGHYYIGEKCEKGDGTKVYSYGLCTGVNCNGTKGAAYGKKECPNNSGTGEVSCGGKKYFDTCTESCNTDEEKNWYSDIKEWGYCYATTNKNNTETNGHYYIGEKCEKGDGTKVYSYGLCTGVHCNGTKGAAYGLKNCSSGTYPSGKTVTCGGVTYAEICKAECSYDYDEAMCAKDGKDFVAKCLDENKKEWGECKDKE